MTHKKIETLEQQIGRRLKKALHRHKLTVVDGARKLGISRQSMFAYIAGDACPSVEILYRACALWGIVICYGGMRFGVRGKDHSRENEKKTSRLTAKKASGQLDLPFTLEDLRSRDVQVKIGKKTPHSAEVQLSIRIAGAQR
jgi:transcriptional regulator with XRE-family HTH domain